MAATTAAAAVRPRRPWSALPLFARVETPPQLPPVSDAASIFRGFSWPDDAAVLSSSPVFNTLGAPPFPSITTTTSPPAAATLSLSTSPSASQPRPRIQHHRPSASSSSSSHHCTNDSPGAPSMEGLPAPAQAPPPPGGDEAAAGANDDDDDAELLLLHHHHSASHAPSEQAASSSAAVLAALGIPLPPNSPSSSPRAWRCAFPGCASRVAFTRGCDLRKHHRRHSQRWFCRVDAACPRSATAHGVGSSGGGGGSNDDDGGRRRWWFASKKDRDRHEAKHCPRIRCSWRGGDEEGGGCGRVFSRLDNMKDHVRRVHGQ